ncbi:hypothetical protein CEXT_103591 [Caerostris extrusa]|uniref:Uncharacterized protein n=1 Tax=Caerostris extrusa TaxID=172846 RepID=A0AAV4PSR3_CAEEX|nr:hypothetical protein CEXT_103591 [Caerostris extrusa]
MHQEGNIDSIDHLSDFERKEYVGIQYLCLFWDGQKVVRSHYRRLCLTVMNGVEAQKEYVRIHYLHHLGWTESGEVALSAIVPHGDEWSRGSGGLRMMVDSNYLKK